MQGINDLAKKIVADFQKTKVMVLTMYNQPKLLEQARQAGLHGYLLKEATTPELLTAIRTVLSGNSSFDTKATKEK